MKFEELIKKAEEDQARADAEEIERQAAEERARREEEAERQRNDENKLRESVERLRVDKERIGAFAEKIGIYAAKIEATEVKGNSARAELLRLYSEIEATLRDPKIQKILAQMSKDTYNADDAIESGDFADEKDVIAAIEARNIVKEADADLVRLQSEERQLHEEVRAAVGADLEPHPTSLTLARSESTQLLEKCIEVLDRELQEAEWQTPEGKKKAEGELGQMIRSEWQGWREFSPESFRMDQRTILRRMLGDDERNPIPAGALQYKEIFGDEKFAEIVKNEYDVMLYELGEKYKEGATGSEAYGQLKMLEEYPGRITRGRRELSEVSAERNEASKMLAEYFMSDEGRESLLNVMYFDNTYSHAIDFSNWQRGSTRGRAGEIAEVKEEYERRGNVEREEIKRMVNDNEAVRKQYAPTMAERVLTQLDSVAKRFVFNEMRSDAGMYPQNFTGKFKASFDNADVILREVNGNHYYEKLPDPAVLETGLAEAREFYRRIPELAGDPGKLKKVYGVSMMIADHGGSGDRSGDSYETSEKMPWHVLDNKISRGSDDHRPGKERELVKNVIEFVPQTEVVDRNKIAKTIPGDPLMARHVRRGDMLPGDREQAERTIAARLQSARQYEVAEAVVFRIKKLTDMEAAADLARAEKAAFGSSSRFKDAQIYEATERKRKFAHGIAREAAEIEARFSKNPDDELHFKRGQLDSEDWTSARLTREARGYQADITEKEHELQNLESTHPEGWGARRKAAAWEDEKQALRENVEILRQKHQATIDELSRRQTMRDALFAAREVLTRISQEFPEEYRGCAFDAASTTGELGDNISAFVAEFSSLQSTEAEATAAEEYRIIVARSQYADESLASRRAAIVHEAGVATRAA